jgi:hypothetical protein
MTPIVVKPYAYSIPVQAVFDGGETTWSRVSATEGDDSCEPDDNVAVGYGLERIRKKEA